MAYAEFRQETAYNGEVRVQGLKHAQFFFPNFFLSVFFFRNYGEKKIISPRFNGHSSTTEKGGRTVNRLFGTFRRILTRHKCQEMCSLEFRALRTGMSCEGHSGMQYRKRDIHAYAGIRQRKLSVKCRTVEVLGLRMLHFTDTSFPLSRSRNSMLPNLKQVVNYFLA